MRPRPKYQVFISSTFGDLREEREAVTWAVLTARHIPAGMENFTAADDRGWKTILSVIDRSDYYVLLLAGRYGSVDTDGLSWTEKEYRYAASKGIPILAFIRTARSTTGDKIDTTPDLVSKVEQFKTSVKQNHLCREWSTKEELVGQVNSALLNHINDDEDSGSARPGWFRGNELPQSATLEEFARLSEENAKLRTELESLKHAEYSDPKCTLVDKDDSPITSKQMMVRQSERLLPVSELACLDDFQEFYHQIAILNEVTPLAIGVRNNGDVAIETVIVDLSFSNLRGFYCGGRYGGSLVNAHGRLISSSIKPELNNVYIDNVTKSGFDDVQIRFRIRRVPARGAVYLPDMLLVPITEQAKTQFKMEYSVIGSGCSPSTGLCEYETLFDGSKELNEDESKQLTHQLRSKYDVEHLSDIYFYKMCLCVHGLLIIGPEQTTSTESWRTNTLLECLPWSKRKEDTGVVHGFDSSLRAKVESSLPVVYRVHSNSVKSEVVNSREAVKQFVRRNADSLVREANPAIFVDEIGVDPSRRGHASRYRCLFLARRNGTVEIDPNPWPDS